jgi:hypothetical protein
MDTLTQLTTLLHLTTNGRDPHEIPNIGRDGLAVLFGQLGFTRGAEIGIEQGLYSETLCKAVPGLLLYCIDPWMAYKGYRDHVSQEELDQFYLNTRARLAPYDVEILRMTSEYAREEVDDDSLDFVYIDGNHELPYVMYDIIWWARKVRKGGIVSGHDYYESTRHDTKNHTVYAVQCYTRSYRIHPWFLLGSKEKKTGEIRDTSRSWLWVKS